MFHKLATKRRPIGLMDVTKKHDGGRSSSWTNVWICVINVYDGTSHSFIIFVFLSLQMCGDVVHISIHNILITSLTLLSNRKKISAVSCEPIKLHTTKMTAQTTTDEWRWPRTNESAAAVAANSNRSHSQAMEPEIYFCRLIGEESIANKLHSAHQFFSLHFFLPTLGILWLGSTNWSLCMPKRYLRWSCVV